MSQKKVFRIEGMSCSHCERAVESSLKSVKGIKSVKASAAKGRAEVHYDGTIDTNEISSVVENAGYKVTGEDSEDEEESGEPKKHFSMMEFTGIVLMVSAILLTVHSTIGFNGIPEIPAHASLGIIFAAGLLTSLHCVIMCGGLAVSQCVSRNSSSCPRRMEGVIPSSMYNGGRVISYSATGAIAGALGSTLNFSPTTKGIIMIIAGLIMAVMGLKISGLLDSLPRLPLPAFLIKDRNIRAGKATPLVVGLLSGLIPCAPLQAMQLYALGSGSAFSGAVAMGVFSLGTVPLMFFIGSLSTILSKRFTVRMFRVSGAFVIILAVIMTMRGINLTGTPLLAKTASGYAVASEQSGIQRVTSSMNAGSYQPIIVKKGIPVEWTLVAKAEDLNGCNNAIIIPEFNIQLKLKPVKNVVRFTPAHDGAIRFSCWMGMIPGTIKVVPSLSDAGTVPNTSASNDSSQQRGGCCRQNGTSQSNIKKCPMFNKTQGDTI